MGFCIPHLPQVEKCSVNYKQKQNQRGKASFGGNLRVSIVRDVTVTDCNLKIAGADTEYRVVHGRTHTLEKQLLPRLAGAAVHAVLLLSRNNAGDPLGVVTRGNDQDGKAQKSTQKDQVEAAAMDGKFPQYEYARQGDRQKPAARVGQLHTYQHDQNRTRPKRFLEASSQKEKGDTKWPVQRNIDRQIVRILEHATQGSGQTATMRMVHRQREEGHPSNGGSLHPNQPPELPQFPHQERNQQRSDHDFGKPGHDRGKGAPTPVSQRNPDEVPHKEP